MATTKLFHLIAFTALALFASSYGPEPVNALSTPGLHARHHAMHDTIARRKRDTTKRDSPKRCRQRPSSSIVASATSAAAPPPSSAPAQTTSKPAGTTAAPAPSSSSAPAPSPAPAPPSGGALDVAKVGLAWPNGPDASLTHFLTPNVGALYTWSPFCPDTDVQCYQMLWGGASDKVSEFKSVVKPAGGNKRVILGFNEPNESGQSNMSPEFACAVWHDAIEPLAKQGYTLVSPATSGNPKGIDWMHSFFNCCKDCTVHAMGVHWYDIHAKDFKSWVQRWHDEFDGRDVLVTEYAVQNFNGGPQASKDEIFAFHQEVGPWLDSQPWVKGYFPFGVNTDNALMAGNGQPTDLGWKIINNAY
ncbi:unnamed protein product [Somion occarium]|uniref:Asl1-like glycosyl hydrolase catalytic domain-containing protein n=1 Tax=Somion occarium TaxID=3059160 RepID=A0ABP1D5P4_9APHY